MLEHGRGYITDTSNSIFGMTSIRLSYTYHKAQILDEIWLTTAPAYIYDWSVSQAYSFIFLDWLELRKLERWKLRTVLEIHPQIFSKAAKEYRWARTSPKRQHYNALVVEAGKNQGELSKITDRLLHKSSDLPLPAHDSSSELPKISPYISLIRLSRSKPLCSQHRHRPHWTCCIYQANCLHCTLHPWCEQTDCQISDQVLFSWSHTSHPL